MTRHPSENFIKYLMTSGHSHAVNNAWIQTTVVNLGYPMPDLDYLVWLRADLGSKMPNGFQANNRYDNSSRKFMKSESIFGMHVRDKSVQEANQIVTNLRARSVVEQLLLGRVEAKDLAKKVNSKMATFFTSEGIEAYRHYYWNVGLLRVEDWAKLLEEYEQQRANTLAIVQVGASMALHKTGFQQQIDSKLMLRTMQEALFFDFQEWRTKKHGMDRSKALAGIAKAAVMVDNQLSQADSAMKESLKAFEQFRMETEKRTVPGMTEVAPGGNYSNSGAKMIEAPIKEDEIS